LYDDVCVDANFGKGAKDFCGYAWLVDDTGDADGCDFVFICYAADAVFLFHGCGLLGDECAGVFVVAVADDDIYVIKTADFYGTGMHDFGSNTCEFDHGFVTDFIEFSGFRNHSGVCCVYAINVGINFTGFAF